MESNCSTILIDPESTDFSEQEFSASLDKARPPVRHSRFVLDQTHNQEGSGFQDKAAGAADGGETGLQVLALGTAEGVVKSEEDRPILTSGAADRTVPAPLMTSEGDSFWKDEVAARLSHYRARRKPRPPKYPSLRLKFGPMERKSDCKILASDACNAPATQESLALSTSEACSAEKRDEISKVSAAPVVPQETAHIIEFPRSYYMPGFSQRTAEGNELADPVLDRPRIVEVPEMEMPAPALGGITLEPEELEPERRPGFELPLQTASKGRRIIASGCDAAIVLGACTLFGYIFFKIAGVLPPISTLGSLGCVLLVLFWSTYQYLLLTYSGTTPGLRISGLGLRQFDGSPVDRGLCRWRVIASILSGLSLGLGYAWCFLDEDALCWHDRITHTYLETLKQDSAE